GRGRGGGRPPPQGNPGPGAMRPPGRPPPPRGAPGRGGGVSPPSPAPGGARCVFLLSLPPAEAARLADRGYGLQERISTALEWADRRDRTPIVDALVRDAAARAGAVGGRRHTLCRLHH